jgi:hypothetical protein
MTRKHWLVVALAIVLGAVSLYLNRDWLAGDTIQIHHRSRPPRPALFGRKYKAPPGEENINPLYFAFDRALKLISVKVVNAADAQTNKYPHELWHLISESNSVPVRDFLYGVPIKGMHPSIKGAQPDSLEPNVQYRLFIETASFKGEHEFTPQPRTQ